jgi:uncharacterized protein (TIGR02996 family)
MTSEGGFVAINESLVEAIRANPADDAPRLVYADWLEENGRPERAEFIRVQCELAKASAKGKRREKLAAREKELLDRYRKEWAAQLVPAAVLKKTGAAYDFIRFIEYERGFPLRVELSIAGLLQIADDVLRAEPVENLVLELGAERYGTLLTKVAACPSLGRVNRLRGHETRLGPAGFEKLMGSPHLGAVRHVYLFEDYIGLRGVRAMVGSASLGQLESLELNGCLVRETEDEENRQASEAAALIAGSPKMARLKKLDLSFNDIGDRGARALAESPYLNELTELDLSENPISEEWQERLTERFPDMLGW